MLKETDEKQWVRVQREFVVEILVGAAWTTHETCSVLSAAEASAKKILVDHAVREVRICEHEVQRTSTMVRHAKQEFEARVPFGMKDTHKKKPCPVCKAPVVVAYDGACHWAVCKLCNQTSPVDVAV